MQSRTSFFNGAAFRKNLSRFAPVMALDTLLIVLLIMMSWSRTNELRRSYAFMQQVGELIGLMGVVNMGYALVVAQLIFGDLFSSRMCNALHALPLRRECWFVTNLVSGFVYSLIPTAVGTVLLLPLLSQTIFAGAWKVAFLFFLVSNLEFICMYGMAVFSTMMVGTRITMIAGYGLLNFGAPIFYWLVNSIYTPMLYGMITPSSLATKLFPAYYATKNFIDPDKVEVFDETGKLLPGVQGQYAIKPEWTALLWLALIGLVFLLAALILYKNRNLECAGDAVCSRKLIPVFQILSALFVGVAAEFFLTLFVVISDSQQYLVFVVLFCGLMVGWFAGRMLVERSPRVFQLRSFAGLGILAAVLAVSMGLTKLDVLHIDERMPAPDEVAKIQIYGGTAFEKEQDIAQILRLQQLCLQERLSGDEGCYVLENGEYVQTRESSAQYWEEGDPLPEQRMRVQMNLVYTLKNEKVMRRRYSFWTDTEQGQIAKNLLSHWDVVNSNYTYVNGERQLTLPLVLASVERFYCSVSGNGRAEDFTKQQAEDLIQAIQADCTAGNMAGNSAYHEGVFRYTDDYGNTMEDNSIYLTILGTADSWDLAVYADCTNTIAWLQANGFLRPDMTIGQRTSPRWY